MTPPDLVQLHDFLATADPAELIGRGHHVTQAGAANRRSTVLLPLLVRWAQVRFVERDAPPHLGKARKGWRLVVADRRWRRQA